MANRYDQDRWWRDTDDEDESHRYQRDYDYDRNRYEYDRRHMPHGQGYGYGNYGQGSSEYGDEWRTGRRERGYGYGDYGQGSMRGGSWSDRDFDRGRYDYQGRYDRGDYGRSDYGRTGYDRDYGMDYGRRRRSDDWGYGRGSERWGMGDDRWSDRVGGRYGRDYGYGRDYDQYSSRYGGQSRYEAPMTWTYTEYWLIPGPETGRGPQGFQRSNERIHEDICERLTQHGQLDASNIQVEVNNGVVTLKGKVNSRRAKRMAEDAVETISGVRDVQNQLQVAEDEEQREGQTERTWGTRARRSETTTAQTS